jgi:hypothetical protein
LHRSRYGEPGAGEERTRTWPFARQIKAGREGDVEIGRVGGGRGTNGEMAKREFVDVELAQPARVKVRGVA